MKPSAIGRIVFWRGGSLWIGLAGEAADFHAHHALQISLPFPPGRVRLKQPSQDWTVYEAAIVAPEQPHAFDAKGQFMAQIFVEPESKEGQKLKALCATQGVRALNIAELSSEIAALAAGFERRASDGELIGLAQTAIRRLSGSSDHTEACDERIVFAIARIRSSLSTKISLDALAKSVHLSGDRFRHLFLEETGVRLRPYILWLRLERSLVAYVSGCSLTDAAHQGGFADSAHFSRTFKKMFGIAPASVRPESPRAS